MPLLTPNKKNICKHGNLLYPFNLIRTHYWNNEYSSYYYCCTEFMAIVYEYEDDAITETHPLFLCLCCGSLRHTDIQEQTSWEKDWDIEELLPLKVRFACT